MFPQNFQIIRLGLQLKVTIRIESDFKGVRFGFFWEPPSVVIDAS